MQILLDRVSPPAVGASNRRALGVTALAGAPRLQASGRRLAAGRQLPNGLQASSGLAGARLGLRRRCSRSQPVHVQAYNRSDKPDAVDRAVASIPYMLPLFDGLRYGKFILLQYPAFGQLLLPLEPLLKLYFSFPFAGLIAFFAVYAGIVNNRNFSRYVRFNAMQAVLLDIILIFPSLLESVFKRPTGGPLLQLYISGNNTIFLFVFACFAYGVGSCVLGQTARLPVVGDAADQQVM